MVVANQRLKFVVDLAVSGFEVVVEVRCMV